MNVEQLEKFNGRSIRFSIGGLSLQGAVHFNEGHGKFKIIYTVVSEGRAHNEDCPLNAALIARIHFDEEINMLTMK